MGKKKGRQSGGFGSKAKKAAWSTEWQSRASEVPLSRVNKQQHSQPQASSSKERPKLRLNHLQFMLQERIHHDRLEDAAHRRQRQQSRETAAAIAQRKPKTPLVVYDVEHEDDYRESGLALLCVQALAPVLQDYITAMGVESVHHVLSLLPGTTLTALSVELSTRNLWKTDDLLYAALHHPQISRIALCLPDEPDNITEDGLFRAFDFTPSPRTTSTVPDSWEDDEAADEVSPMIRRLQRLDLRNISHSTFLQNVLSKSYSSLTHLSLCESSTVSCTELVKCTRLRLLDLSHCSWVSSRLLQRLEKELSSVIRAQGCELIEQERCSGPGRWMSSETDVGSNEYEDAWD